MVDQQNMSAYNIIKVAVAGDKWATKQVHKYCDDYMIVLYT